MRSTFVPSIPRARQKLDALTSLRFLAAFHVVLFHWAPTLAGKSAAAISRLTHNEPAAVGLVAMGFARATVNILRVGPWSVSFFFVLSGFILVYNYGDDRRPLNTARFWVARLARIYPVYLLGFFLAMPFVLNSLWQAHEHAHQAVTAGFLAVTLSQSWVPRFATFWNIPAWSMSDEAFFYALFPILLVRIQHLRSAGGW
jgi:peptidoglycan/LPS O-acetylase OafA/YrhL